MIVLRRHCPDQPPLPPSSSWRISERGGADGRSRAAALPCRVRTGKRALRPPGPNATPETRPLAGRRSRSCLCSASRGRRYECPDNMQSVTTLYFIRLIFFCLLFCCCSPSTSRFHASCVRHTIVVLYFSKCFIYATVNFLSAWTSLAILLWRLSLTRRFHPQNCRVLLEEGFRTNAHIPDLPVCHDRNKSTKTQGVDIALWQHWKIWSSSAIFFPFC